MNAIPCINSLILFEAIRTDEIVRVIAGLGPAESADPAGLGTADRASAEPLIRDAYYSTNRMLQHNVGHGEISGNYLQDHLCRVIAGEENSFALMAERGAFKELRPGMDEAGIKAALDPEPFFILMLAAREIEHIAPIYNFDFAQVTDTADGRNIAALPVDLGGKTSVTDTADGRNIAALPVDPVNPIAPGGKPSHPAPDEKPSNPAPDGKPSRPASDEKSPRPAPEWKTSHLESIHKAMTQGKGSDAAIMLAHYYHGYGSGVFGAAPALSAEPEGLAPVLHMDDVTMDDIIGCENQKDSLKANISILLSGLRANNMLLYGDSGTGKSSSVKALLNMYAGDGLKLISITKDRLHLLPDIFKQIADRGMKFIIFIDDLSFEENEHEYKVFKSIVEGRVAPRPKNTVFIVTTNRKNIVKDVWGDREGQDDVRRRDNMEEKRSLSDRFGITLVYSAPDMREYLAIVRGIADKAGLSMPDDELKDEALKWEIRHGGRSGRTARQFVDHMTGIKAIGANSIGANSIDANSIDANSIDANSIGANSIDANSIDAKTTGPGGFAPPGEANI